MAKIQYRALNPNWDGITYTSDVVVADIPAGILVYGWGLVGEIVRPQFRPMVDKLRVEISNVCNVEMGRHSIVIKRDIPRLFYLGVWKSIHRCVSGILRINLMPAEKRVSVEPVPGFDFPAPGLSPIAGTLIILPSGRMGIGLIELQLEAGCRHCESCGGSCETDPHDLTSLLRRHHGQRIATMMRRPRWPTRL